MSGISCEGELPRRRSHSTDTLLLEAANRLHQSDAPRRAESFNLLIYRKGLVNGTGKKAAPETVKKDNCVEPQKTTEPRIEKSLTSCGSADIEDEVCFICMGAFTRKSPPTAVPCLSGCNSSPVHAKCIYEWSERQKTCASCPLCRGQLGKVTYNPPDILKSSLLVMFGCRKAFVTLPVPRKVGVVRCYLYVERKNRTLGSGLLWKMYLQAPARLRYPLGPLPNGDNPVPGDRLLLVAKKRPLRQKNTAGAMIDISLDADCKDFSISSVQYVGSVRSSALGLEHTIISPVQEPMLPRRANRIDYVELGYIRYTQNRFGRAVGPRRMRLVLPNVTRPTTANSSTLNYQAALNAAMQPEEEDDTDSEDQESTCEWASSQVKWTTKAHRPASNSKTLKAFLRRNIDPSLRTSAAIIASNREPYWLDQIGAYSLDFQGRVTLPSNKNFQLVTQERPNEVFLQFGKVERQDTFEIYTMDIQWPLSPLQAFGICLSACDRKLACA